MAVTSVIQTHDRVKLVEKKKIATELANMANGWEIKIKTQSWCTQKEK